MGMWHWLLLLLSLALSPSSKGGRGLLPPHMTGWAGGGQAGRQAAVANHTGWTGSIPAAHPQALGHMALWVPPPPPICEEGEEEEAWLAQTGHGRQAGNRSAGCLCCWVGGGEQDRPGLRGVGATWCLRGSKYLSYTTATIQIFDHNHVQNEFMSGQHIATYSEEQKEFITHKSSSTF